jgi:hypothetical protein
MASNIVDDCLRVSSEEWQAAEGFIASKHSRDAAVCIIRLITLTPEFSCDHSDSLAEIEGDAAIFLEVVLCQGIKPVH